MVSLEGGLEIIFPGGEVGRLRPVGGVIVTPAVVESVHHNGDNVGLVPSHPLLSHPCQRIIILRQHDNTTGITRWDNSDPSDPGRCTALHLHRYVLSPLQDWSGKITTDFGTRVFWNWRWNETWYPDLDYVVKELDDQGVKVTVYLTGRFPFLNFVFVSQQSAGR